MEAFSQQYLQLGCTPIGITLLWDDDANKKHIFFKPLWEQATLTNSKEFFDKRDNGIALVTGEASDLIVVDCDVLKPKDLASGIRDGRLAFEALVETLGIPEATPIQESASGGKHYFFSLSKSLHNGLLSAKNTCKLSIDGQTYSIDTRGDKGCIIVAPSFIEKDGKKSPYKFLKPLVPRADMPPMPDWCIKHLNANNKHASTKLEPAMRSLTLSPKGTVNTTHCLDDSIALFIAQIDTTIENALGTKMACPLRPRTGGFDFKPATTIPCTLCGETHTSNNYRARQILEECFYMRNYSSRCITKAFNWEEHSIITKVIEYPTTDLPYCRMLQATFRTRGYTLVYALKQGAVTGRFLCFNGHVWQELPSNVVAREVESICGTVLDTLLKYVHPPLGCTDKDELKKISMQQTQLQRGRGYVSRITNTKCIVEMFRVQNTDTVIESQLDTNPDLLVVQNGVIELKTGTLREGTPSDYMMRQLCTEYNGLDSSTKDIEAFVGDVFNHNTELIEYVQKLLGYGITGHTNEQCWLIFTGSGSNGKSLFVGLLEKLLEHWYITAPYDIFFKSGKRTQAGGPSPHLSMLKGARICVKEETEPKDELNIEMIKIVTGESTITSRAMYAKEYDSFVPTALPILLCNHKPAIDVDDDAMLRRIKVVPFTNVYTTPEDTRRPYDANNPRHRLKDTGMRKKLLTEYSQEQLLVWLVQGAVKWYANGLGKMPQCMIDAFNEYCTENDKLHAFIDEYCEVAKAYKVNASAFRETFKEYLGGNVQQTVLIEMMKKRGFTYGNVKMEKFVIKMYRGLQLKNI